MTGSKVELLLEGVGVTAIGLSSLSTFSVSYQIIATPGKALTEFRFLPIYLDTFRFYVLRRSSDEIAQANGWRFHVDRVHLNRRGGMILTDLVQEFLDS